jgi:hypothetical protein
MIIGFLNYSANQTEALAENIIKPPPKKIRLSGVFQLFSWDIQSGEM